MSATFFQRRRSNSLTEPETESDTNNGIDFEAMSTDELTEYAKNNGIDLGHVKNRSLIIKKIIDWTSGGGDTDDA